MQKYKCKLKYTTLNSTLIDIQSKKNTSSLSCYFVYKIIPLPGKYFSFKTVYYTVFSFSKHRLACIVFCLHQQRSSLLPSFCFIMFSKLINGESAGKKNRYENVYFALLKRHSLQRLHRAIVTLQCVKCN